MRRILDGSAKADGHPLRAADRAWWRMHSRTTPLVIAAVLLFDDALDVERVRDVVQRRIGALERFGERVEDGDRARPRWRRDSHFDITAHVRASALDAGDARAVWTRVGALLGEPLDPRRPPWCLDIVRIPEGGTVLVARIHHAIADGIALMLVLLALTDLLPEDREALDLGRDENPLALLFQGDARGPRVARQYIERFLPGGRALLRRGLGVRPFALPAKLARAAVDALRLALSRNDPPALASPKGPVRRVAWSDPIPLADLKRLAHRLDATINDVLLAALSGALRQIVGRRGGALERDIRAAVPVNLRPLDAMAELGNRFGLAFVPLPVSLPDRSARLRALRSATRRLKRSGQPLATYALLQLCGAGPRPLTEAVFWLFEKKVSAVITNVPGPSRRLSLAGAEVAGMMFWVPTARTHLGLSICSYAGSVVLGAEADAELLEDPLLLVTAFERELEDLFDDDPAGLRQQSRSRRPTAPWWRGPRGAASRDV